MVSACLQSSLAKSSQASYRSAWRTFFRFLMAYEWNPLPPSQALFCRFAAWMYCNEISYGTIRNYIGSLPALYISVGIEISVSKTSYPALSRCLKGIRRRSGFEPRAKSHLSFALLSSFRDKCNLRNRKCLAHWSAICVGFFSFLRSANLVPKLKGLREPESFLLRRNFRFAERGALLFVNFTKTIQFGERSLEIPIPYIPKSFCCPVTAVRCLITLCPLSDSVPLFSWSETEFVTYSSLLQFIKLLASQVGLDPSDFGTHSLRSGGATCAAECGAPDFLLKAQGDWKSDAYLRYIHVSPDERWSLPLMMASAAQVSAPVPR